MKFFNHISNLRYSFIVDRNELIYLITLYLLVQYPLLHTGFSPYNSDGQSPLLLHCTKIIKKWKMFATIKCILLNHPIVYAIANADARKSRLLTIGFA